VTLFAILVLAATMQTPPPAWVQHGPDGAIARVIIEDGGKCPPLVLDGREHEMRVHSSPAENYEVTVCEAPLPAVRSASISGTELPAEKLRRPERIVLIGDTGCRRKAGGKPQDCKDPKQWPFATMAASIAEWNPDAIIHVGDYYYREATSCTATTCTGTTYNWQRWKADFFTPAAPLLAKAPWVFVRGNHEECGRAAEGWVRFLDPHNYVWENDQTCTSNIDLTPPYRVSLGGMEVAVLDSSAAKDSSKKQSAFFAGQLGVLDVKPGAWLVLHHPFWAMDYTDPATETMWDAWQQAGSTATDPLALVISGHIHLLETLSFTDGKTPQVVAGNGGTSLDGAPTNGQGMNIGGRTVANFMAQESFGYITATRSGEGWTFEVRNPDGTPRTKCAVTVQSVVCN